MISALCQSHPLPASSWTSHSKLDASGEKILKKKQKRQCFTWSFIDTVLCKCFLVQAVSGSGKKTRQPGRSRAEEKQRCPRFIESVFLLSHRKSVMIHVSSWMGSAPMTYTRARLGTAGSWLPAPPWRPGSLCGRR